MYKEEKIVLAEKENASRSAENTQVAESQTEQEDFVIKKAPKESVSIEQENLSQEADKPVDTLRDVAKRQKEFVLRREMQEEVKAKESSIIEKPNYDFIEPLTSEQEERIFKIEREKKTDTKPKFNGKRMRIAIFSILLAVFGVWGIVNVAKIDLLQQSYNALYEQYYNINLPNYLKNLGQLDAVNQSNMDNLFETIPEETVPPATIDKKSNWFDRICEFLVGLFGG